MKRPSVTTLKSWSYSWAMFFVLGMLDEEKGRVREANYGANNEFLGWSVPGMLLIFHMMGNMKIIQDGQ